jgi:hypothetical protein
MTFIDVQWSAPDAGLTIAVAIGYAVLRRVLRRACELPERAYRAPFILGAAMRRPLFLLVALGAVAVPLLIPGAHSWRTSGDGGALHVVCSALGLTFGWTLASQPVNRYMGRGHAADRLIILGLALGVVIAPAALPAFLVAATAFWRQVRFPWVIFESSTDKLPVHDALVVIGAYLPLTAIDAQPGHALLVILGVTGAYYFYPGLAKLRIGPRPLTWVLRNRVHHIVQATWVHGYLAHRPAERIRRFARLLRPLDVPIQAATLGVELGALLLAADRVVAAAVLGGCLLMHLGILAVSGIGFWKWMLLDAALIAGVLLLPDAQAALALGLQPLLLAGAVIATAPWHSSPAWLAWFDAPYANAFRYECLTRSGALVRVPGTFFGPHDQAMCQGRLRYLVDAPALVGIFGNIRRRGRRVDSWTLTRLIERSGGDAQRLARLKARAGINSYDARMAGLFDVFIRRHIEHWNRRPRRRALWWLPGAPAHFLHTSPDPAPAPDDPIVALRVRYVEAWCGDGGVRVLEDRVVREVPMGVAEQVPARPIAPRMRAARLG